MKCLYELKLLLTLALILSSFTSVVQAEDEVIVDVKLADGSLAKVSVSELRKSINAYTPGITYVNAVSLANIEDDEFKYEGVVNFSGIKLRALDEIYNLADASSFVNNSKIGLKPKDLCLLLGKSGSVRHSISHAFRNDIMVSGVGTQSYTYRDTHQEFRPRAFASVACYSKRAKK
jgi:hypothetical protein